MDVSWYADRLERFPSVLTALVGGLTPAEARWTPREGDWSIVEIVSHLADEETDDFRPRIRSTLEDPARAWPVNDLTDVSARRGYARNDLKERLTVFTRERGESVRWLCGLEGPDWSLSYVHPSAGPLPAGEILASWAAHDQLHLRQIAKRLFERSVRDAGPVAADYAGGW